MNTPAHIKKLEIILASVLTLVFLGIAVAFFGFSYFKFKTPIQKVEFTPQGSNAMVVNVQSSTPLKTRVEYGTSDIYLNSSDEAEAFQTSQTHTIWGLLPEKKHFYRVVAVDESGQSYTTKFYQY